MTKASNQRFHLKRCSCGHVARGVQAKGHFAKEGHVVRQQVTACTNCQVVASPDELATGAFKRKHGECPRDRANSRKVRHFMRWLEHGAANLEAPDPTTSTPVPVDTRPPHESEETERAVRSILPSPIREKESSGEDDVDLDRTPKATKVERLSSESSDSSDDNESADEEKDGQPSKAPRQPPAPSSSAPRPVSQTVEMVALQDRIRGLSAELERAREEARVNADKARMIHSLHQKATTMEAVNARLRQERNAAREEVLSVRRELAQANEARAAAETQLASQRQREAQGRTAGRTTTWLLHVPVRRNRYLYHDVHLHKTSESFRCLEGDDDARCFEVQLTVSPNGDIEYSSLKRRREPDDGQPASQRPRRE